MRLSQSLFLALLVTALSVVGLTLVVVQGFTARSFSDYVEARDRARADALVEELIESYDDTLGWELVLRDPRRWPDLYPGQSRPNPPPHLRDLRPPPPPRLNEWKPQQDDERPRPRRRDSRPGRNGVPMFILYDVNKSPLSYQNRIKPDQWVLQPIELEGQRIGWLGRGIRNKVTLPLDQQFAKRQRIGLLVVAAGALLLTALLAMFFAWRLSLPIKRLSKGARSLAAGEFSLRLPETGQKELAELAADFNQLAISLSDSETRQLQWLADVAHELRTPLAVLRGEIEALQDGIRPLDPKALGSLHQEVMHLTGLINDLHTLSMAEAGELKLHRQPQDIVTLVKGQVGRFAEQMTEKGLRLEASFPDQPCVVNVDGQRIQQLLDNLLGNLLRYAVPGRAAVTVSSAGQAVQITVADSGPGVPEHSLQRLFDRLYRTDAARSRHQGGTGLGMAICRSIVEGHGGRISASNNDWGGLSICIDLPVSGTRP